MSAQLTFYFNMKNISRSAFFLVFSLAIFIFPRCKNASSDSDLEIGLVCSNLEQSLHFYKNIIGFRETGGFDVDAQFSTDAALSDGKPFKVKLLRLNDGAVGTNLKLACCSDSTLQTKPAYVNITPGMKYLTLNVASTKAVKERLRQNGIRLLGKTPVPVGDDSELIMVQDPDGVFVEIIGKRE
jgi:catechol 2,3-dioxygenase-like lactoylglutathione lyase family enzyme